MGGSCKIPTSDVPDGVTSRRSLHTRRRETRFLRLATRSEARAWLYCTETTLLAPFHSPTPPNLRVSRPPSTQVDLSLLRLARSRYSRLYSAWSYSTRHGSARIRASTASHLPAPVARAALPLVLVEHRSTPRHDLARTPCGRQACCTGHERCQRGGGRQYGDCAESGDEQEIVAQRGRRWTFER